MLLLVAALIALAWANSPWRAAYHDLGATTVGPSAWHLDLSLATWAADALLAVFFFVAGLELKREFVAGDLRDLRKAALPVAAAVGGTSAPALIYPAVVTARGTGDAAAGWAIPVATDIATWATQRFTRAQLSPELSWWDVFGLAVLAGMGFTVSLLIGELAFDVDGDRNDQARIGILLGSLLAAVVLRVRNQRYRDTRVAEELDLDADGVPDVFTTDKP